MKKVSLLLLLLAISLVFSPVVFAQDEEATPDVTGEGETVTVVDEDGNEVQAVITPFVEEPPAEEEPGGIDLPPQDVIIEAALLLLGTAIAISQFIDQLKERGKIEKGAAGKWSKYTGLVISVLGTILAQVLPPDTIEAGREFAMMISGVLVTAYIFAGSSKSVYWLGKKFGANDRYPDKKGQPVG